MTGWMTVDARPDMAAEDTAGAAFGDHLAQAGGVLHARLTVGDVTHRSGHSP